MNTYEHVKSQIKQYETDLSLQIEVNEIKHIYKIIVSHSLFGKSSSHSSTVVSFFSVWVLLSMLWEDDPGRWSRSKRSLAKRRTRAILSIWLPSFTINI